jgi:hypothetical protein
MSLGISVCVIVWNIPSYTIYPTMIIAFASVLDYFDNSIRTDMKKQKSEIISQVVMRNEHEKAVEQKGNKCVMCGCDDKTMLGFVKGTGLVCRNCYQMIVKR